MAKGPWSFAERPPEETAKAEPAGFTQAANRSVLHGHKELC